MDPARRVTVIVLAIVAVLFGWHIAADRATPYTDLGKVDGYVVPVAPQVSGYVTEVPVVLNQIVEEGDLLLRIHPFPYELAVNSARAQLELSGQQVRAQTSAIESAAGRLGVSRAQLDRAQRNFNRVEAIAVQNPGALSQADRDRATTQLRCRGRGQPGHPGGRGRTRAGGVQPRANGDSGSGPRHRGRPPAGRGPLRGGRSAACHVDLR
jgi:multidrug resistance efflux pump